MFETEKILLRACEPGDLIAMYEWENEQSWWLLSDTTKPFSKYTMEEFIKQDQNDIFHTRQQRFIIELKHNLKVIGIIDLYSFDPIHRRAGVGILIGDLAQRRKKFAFDALQLLHEYAFGTLNMKQLFCYIQDSNKASINLFEKAGYENCGCLKNWMINNEVPEDVWMFQYFKK
jgi:diamine N-acetyltransferase